MSVVVNAKGRTGVHRSKLQLRATYDEDSKTISLRVDDAANLEFWLEATLPYPPPASPHPHAEAFVEPSVEYWDSQKKRSVLDNPDLHRDMYLG